MAQHKKHQTAQKNYQEVSIDPLERRSAGAVGLAPTIGPCDRLPRMHKDLETPASARHSLDNTPLRLPAQ